MIPGAIQSKVDSLVNRFTLLFLVLFFVAFVYYLYLQHRKDKVMMNSWAMSTLRDSKETGIPIDNTLINRSIKGDIVNDLVQKTTQF